jgi:hypothetical protein
MTQPSDVNRFQRLPEPVGPDEFVETVDTAHVPVRGEDTEERERLLRTAGGSW